MERWTRLVLRHRWLVLAVWAIVFVTAGLASSKLADLLTNRFTLPGTDSQKVEQILQVHFGQRSTGSFTLVVEAVAGNAEALVPQVEQAAGRAAEQLPTGKLVSVEALGSSVVAAQIVSDLDPADAKGNTKQMRAAAGSIPGASVYLTGQAATEHDLDPVFAEDLKTSPTASRSSSKATRTARCTRTGPATSSTPGSSQPGSEPTSTTAAT